MPCAPEGRDRPLTAVAGYLGSGKTTWINRLLQAAGGRRFGVIVNDFGTIPLDAGWIRNVDGRTAELTNGCVCCGIADDLGAAIEPLLTHTPPLDHFVLEASGVARPAKLAALAQTWPGLRDGGVLVLADAPRIAGLANDKFVGALVRAQLNAADRIVATKLDTTDEPTRALADLVALAPDRDIASLDNPPAALLEALAERSTPTRTDAAAAPAARATFTSAAFERDGALERDELVRTLEALPELVRVKGQVRLIGSHDAWLVQRTQAGLRLERSRALPSLRSNALVAIWPSGLGPLEPFAEL